MRQAQGADDDELLRRMWAGDEAAFTAIYRRHHGFVYRFAIQMSGKAEIAEEVTQEVFMLLMRGRGQFDSARGPFAAYLYGVARNLVRRALERERPYAAGIDDTGEQAELVAGEDVLGDLTKAEEVELLRQAILLLPEPYREAVVLCELQELDYAQAAIVIGCPVGTVRSRLHRARALLVWKMRDRQRCPA